MIIVLMDAIALGILLQCICACTCSYCKKHTISEPIRKPSNFHSSKVYRLGLCHFEEVCSCSIPCPCCHPFTRADGLTEDHVVYTTLILQSETHSCIG